MKSVGGYLKNLLESGRTSKSVSGDFKNLPEVCKRSKSVAGDILISCRPFHSGIGRQMLCVIRDHLVNVINVFSDFPVFR